MQINKEIEKISIQNIIPSASKIRNYGNEDSLSELTNSIKNYGIIQPLLLRKKDDKYEVISGNRRLEAAKKANLTEIPAIITNMSDIELEEILLIENLSYQALLPLEEAKTYQRLKDITKLGNTELANKIGKKINVIENKLKLLDLSPKVQEALQNNKISEGHAKLLLQLNNFDKQEAILRRIIDERITVRETEQIIKDNITTEKGQSSFNSIIKENNKEEVNKMNNNETQVKSEFDGLLKVEAVPQVMETPQPAPQPNPFLEEKPTMFGGKFFPSLEDENLNMGATQPVMPTTPEVTQPVVNNTQSVESVMPVVEPTMPTQPIITPTPLEPVMTPVAQPTPMPTSVPEMPTVNSIPEAIPSVLPVDTTIPTSVPPVTEPVMSVPETPVMVTPEQVVTPVATAVNVTDAITMLKIAVLGLEAKGFKVESQELDSQGEYQLTLKIKK